MFAPGDAFLLKADQDLGRRKFYFIASDPAQDSDNILLLPISSWDEGEEDLSCVLEVAECGECEFVTHKSYVAYGHAKVRSSQSLSQSLRDGKVVQKKNVGSHILTKARQKALSSQDIARKYRLLLSKQGLLSAP